MGKKVNIFEKHKYMFFFALIILFSQFIGNHDKIYDPFSVIISYHAVDFKIGCVSRVLPGEIFQWFFSHPTLQNIKYFELALLVFVVLSASYFLENLYFSAKKEENKQIYLYLILIFCISGNTFNMYYRQLGMLDVYWVYAFVFFLAFLQNKKTWFLIPLSFAFMIAVHYASLLCYIPLMSTILLYKASAAEEKSEKRYLVIVFAVSVIVALSAFIFFHYNEEHNLKMTPEELKNYLLMKGTDHDEYYLYSYFKKFSIESPERELRFDYIELIKSDRLPAFLKKFINEIAWQTYINISLFKHIPYAKQDAVRIIVILMSSGVPVLAYIYGTFSKTFSSSKDKLKRFSCLCAMALFPFTFLSSIIFSYDYARWYAHAFTCCFIIFFVVLKTEGEKLPILKNNTISKTEKAVFLLYLVLMFLIRFDPYRVVGT